jgi:hypothetical protein
MKYTKEQLEGMSDLEVTEVIAKKLGMEIITQSDDSVVCGYAGLRSTVAGRNYCTNWNDIMPLAVEHDVAYLKDDISAYHQLYSLDSYFEYKFKFRNDVPQRAIACCLILVLQEQ